jgi:hypothetical protein
VVTAWRTIEHAEPVVMVAAAAQEGQNDQRVRVMTGPKKELVAKAWTTEEENEQMMLGGDAATAE